MRDLWNSRWGAAVLVILLVIAYQWLVAPSLIELRNDLAFLHAARLQAIQQAQHPPKAGP